VFKIPTNTTTSSSQPPPLKKENKPSKKTTPPPPDDDDIPPSGVIVTAKGSFRPGGVYHTLMRVAESKTWFCRHCFHTYFGPNYQESKMGNCHGCPFCCRECHYHIDACENV